MKKVTIKNFMIVLCLLVALTSIGPVFAQETGEVPKLVEIKKVIEKQADVYSPSTTFSFEVKSWEGPDQQADATNGKKEIKKGPEGGVIMEDTDIASTPKDEDINKEKIELTDTAKLKINEDKFTAPGIYRYVVTEKKGNYKGIKYSDTIKYFDVYVDSENKPYSYTFVKDGKDGKSDEKDTEAFVNKYDPKGDETEDDKWISSVKVKKQVDGSMGDKNKLFNFNISVKGQNGEKFYVKKSNGEKVATIDGNAQQPTKVQLKNNDEIEITGLSSDDKFTVEEEDYSKEGYKTKYTVGDKEEVNVQDKSSTKDGVSVTVVNSKEINTPTGLIIAYGPYIAVLGFALALFAIFARNRNEEDAE